MLSTLNSKDWSGLINPETGLLYSNYDKTRLQGLIQLNTVYMRYREVLEGKGNETPKFYYVSKTAENRYTRDVGVKEKVAERIDYAPECFKTHNFYVILQCMLESWAASVVRSLLILQGKGVEVQFAQQRCVNMADVDIIRPFPEDLYYKWCARNVNPLDDDFMEPQQKPKPGKPGIYLIDWGNAEAVLNLAYARSLCADAQAYSLKGDGVKTRREWSKGSFAAERRRVGQVADWIRKNDIVGLF